MGFIPVTNKINYRLILATVLTCLAVGAVTWFGFDITSMLLGVIIGVFHCLIAESKQC